MKMEWFTNEDHMDTTKKINPRLVKYTPGDLIANMPNQFRRFNLCNLNDIKTIVATCTQPMKLMVTHNRVSSANEWGHKRSPNDPKSTPFHILEISDCRRVMLRESSDNLTNEQKTQLVEAKRRHLENCKTCFKVFRDGFIG